NAKNDEVLEAEVIEEVGLNEPMKFLEFQQRKLLTYIKENTPLRLLEHKKELKTRDILNFLEQSALNGKQKVFLMRNLERDFTKLKEDFKELESQSFKRDLLDKTKPLRKAEKEELTSEVLEQVQKENLKLYLNDTSGNLTKFLNAKKPFKITMRGANIKHILNRHGENSTLAKNGQPFVNLEDIKKYDEIINNADRQILKENDKGEKTLLSGKQINGHYIVISSVRLKNGELKLKTMYKENGKLENDKAFKSVKLPSETPSVLRGQSLTTDLDGYPSHADESIPQNSEKLPFEMQVLDEDKLSGDEVRLLANKIGEKSTMAYFKDYLLKMDKNFHARAKDIIREYYKIEPFRKELENQWENVKEAYKNGEMSLKEFKFLSKYKDEKSFLNQVAGVLWLQNDELVKNRGYTINKYGMTEQGKGDNYYQNLALEYGKAQTALKKWFYYIQKANKQAQRFFNKKELDEFGINFEGFKGKEAVDKLLSEKRGQVKGAFYKEGLGEIDLVWGDENFGLRHIIDKHGDEFEDIAAELDEIIAKGVLEKGEHRYFIKHNDYKGMIALDYKGKESNAWILTLYKDKSALNPAYQHQIKHNTNTSSETRANGEFENSNIKNANLQKEKVDKLFHGDAEVISAQGKFNELEALNLTDEDIIPQQKIKFAMEKFHYDEKKAKDLLEWHKNSHALTKDENGLPKVFYHGSKAKFEVFEKDFDKTNLGFWFSPDDNTTIYGKEKYPVFLKGDFLDLTKKETYLLNLFHKITPEIKNLKTKNLELFVREIMDKKDIVEKFKTFLKSYGINGIVMNERMIVVFDSNQIKHIDNKGSFTDTKGNVTSKKPKDKEVEFSYFNEKSDNIYHSNPHLGAGLVGGVL
ncbi:hypothetical protein ACIQIM_001801, partial [Campylobacter upsaliensis]